ncbi:MOSC domain-containing protein [Paenibacillus larvae]
MAEPLVKSVNAGMPIEACFHGKLTKTGIFKTPVKFPVFLNKTNLTGDGQADLKYHGGPDKALCIYCYEHYPFWESNLQQNLSFGAFGENLTVEGMPENEVYIGNIFQFGVPEIVSEVANLGYTGYYARILEEGTISDCPEIKLLKRDAKEITVSFANRLKYHERENKKGILNC